MGKSLALIVLTVVPFLFLLSLFLYPNSRQIANHEILKPRLCPLDMGSPRTTHYDHCRGCSCNIHAMPRMPTKYHARTDNYHGSVSTSLNMYTDHYLLSCRDVQCPDDLHDFSVPSSTLLHHIIGFPQQSLILEELPAH